jgi:hypothetical protein
MLAFTSSGQLLWSQPNDTPQMATLGGGVTGSSGITYDQNGNANGQAATGITQSWLGYTYQASPSFSLLADAASTPDPSFSPFQNANQSANNTAKQQISATLDLRFGGNLHVSANDPRASDYMDDFGTLLLGMQSGIFTPPNEPPNPGCIAGYELVGTVTPKTSTGPVTIKRSILSHGCYLGSQPITTGCSTGDDTGNLITTDPSADSKGQVFNLDAAGYYFMPTPIPSNVPLRDRVNFETFAVGPDGTPISRKIKFYVRLSCQSNPSGTPYFNQDISGDNLLGTGTTPITPGLN